MPLADFQAKVRGAIVDGDAAPLAALLTGRGDPLNRFSIHQRHYETNLVRTLLGKFPAMEWLAGSAFMSAGASDFIRRHPPSAPCIAEYGEGFPAFVGEHAEGQHIPWLRWVGELEWRLGHASLAIEQTPLSLAELSEIAPERLADCILELQPGLHYLAAPWPVDALVTLFLEDNAPERYALDAADVLLEVRGARGAFSMTRLDAGTYVFSQTLQRGISVGAAAEQALDADPNFDAGRGLVRLIAADLAIAIRNASEETP